MIIRHAGPFSLALERTIARLAEERYGFSVVPVSSLILQEISSAGRAEIPSSLLPRGLRSRLSSSPIPQLEKLTSKQLQPVLQWWWRRLSKARGELYWQEKAMMSIRQSGAPWGLVLDFGELKSSNRPCPRQKRNKSQRPVEKSDPNEARARLFLEKWLDGDPMDSVPREQNPPAVSPILQVIHRAGKEFKPLALGAAFLCLSSHNEDLTGIDGLVKTAPPGQVADDVSVALYGLRQKNSKRGALESYLEAATTTWLEYSDGVWEMFREAKLDSLECRVLLATLAHDFFSGREIDFQRFLDIAPPGQSGLTSMCRCLAPNGRLCRDWLQLSKNFYWPDGDKEKGGLQWLGGSLGLLPTKRKLLFEHCGLLDMFQWRPAKTRKSASRNTRQIIDFKRKDGSMK